jgi:asparagine synthase (glutamine-hydrolysing)
MLEISGSLSPSTDCHGGEFVCDAPHTLNLDGVRIGLLGAAIWRGDTITRYRAKDLLAAIITRYKEAGMAVLDDLHGPFAISIVEPRRCSALLAIDRMGIERLAYAQRNDRLVFATSVNTVADLSECGRSLRHQALFDYLFMHMVPSPETVYEDIYKLPPATALQFKNGSVALRRYWQPSYDYAQPSDFEDLKDALLAAIKAGVNSSGPDNRTGAFLSGGLDSSSVAGTLAGVSSNSTKTFTVGFGEADEYDELRYSRIANRHFGCQAFEFKMAPADIVEAFPKIARAYDEPFGNSSAAPTYFCAKMAVDNGVNHLLAGDGGDELFGGNERYVRQSVFEMYSRVPRWLRHAAIEPLTRLISPESRVMPLRKLRSYVDQAMIPLPERFETWNFMYREGRKHMLDAEFAGSIDYDAPLKLMREVWKDSSSGHTLERMLRYDWRFTLADNDLRKVGTMTALAGIRVSYPLLHPDVINLSTRVPPQMKIKGIELRDFYKRAMADFLPREIIEKKKHGFGLPFGDWLKTDRSLADMIYSNLSDLKKRRILSAEFIDNLVEQHRSGHPSYFGYAIWDLAMLEAWLVCHIDRPA